MEKFIAIGFYFALILATGILFRRYIRDIKDFLRGRGRVPWWIVGVSAFVSQFSAWSFTVGAGKAYRDGFPVLIIYWASALAFLAAGIYWAPRLRQLRVNTPLEAVRLRFGSRNEKILAFLSIPNYLIFPAIWLNGLTVFLKGAFGWDSRVTIWTVGLTLIGMSLLGGAWAVLNSDFLQFLIILVVGIICAVAALAQVGGPLELIHRFPVRQISGAGINTFSVFVLWVLYMVLQKFASQNNLMNSVRFLPVKDSISAKKAAFLAAGVYLIGSFIWFLPPWVARIYYPDAQALYPELGARASNAAYLIFLDKFMPSGMISLMAVALMAATMSSVDSGINWTVGFCIGSLSPKAGDKKKLLSGRFLTVLFGFLIIGMALYYNALWGISLFDLTYQLLTYLYYPLLIPVFWGLFLRKTPDSAFPLTLFLGLGLSLFMAKTPFLKQAFAFFGYNDLSKAEWASLQQVGGFLVHTVVTGGFFLLSRFFFRGYRPDRQKQVDRFFLNLKTPVRRAAPGYERFEESQKILLAGLTLIIAFGFALMLFFSSGGAAEKKWYLIGFLALGLFGVFLGKGSFFKKKLSGENAPALKT